MSATRGPRLPQGAIYIGAIDEASGREVDERMQRQAREPDDLAALELALRDWMDNPPSQQIDDDLRDAAATWLEGRDAKP